MKRARRDAVPRSCDDCSCECQNCDSLEEKQAQCAQCDCDCKNCAPESESDEGDEGDSEEEPVDCWAMSENGQQCLSAPKSRMMLGAECAWFCRKHQREAAKRVIELFTHYPVYLGDEPVRVSGFQLLAEGKVLREWVLSVETQMPSAFENYFNSLSPWPSPVWLDVWIDVPDKADPDESLVAVVGEHDVDIIGDRYFDRVSAGGHLVDRQIKIRYTIVDA